MIPEIDQILNNPALKPRWQETQKELRVNDLLFSRELHAHLNSLAKVLEEHQLGSVIFHLDTNSNITFDQSQPFNESDDKEPGNLQINKKNVLTYFFTEKGLLDYLWTETALPSSGIQLYFLSKSFSTKTTQFLAFGTQPNSFASISLSEQPQKHVKTIGEKAAKFLPSQLECWILMEDKIDQLPEAWTSVATLKLLSSVCSEFAVLEESIIYEFKGDRRKKLQLSLSSDTDAITSLFPLLNNLADWTYRDARDIDAKMLFFHQYLCYGLSEQPTNYTASELIRTFESAFDNAKLNYDYYLKGLTKDLQKNLTDLTKTLQELQSKIKQNISDLSTGLWKDVTTVIGFLVLNFAIKEDNFIDQYFNPISLGLCGYVAISFAITSLNGFWYYYDARNSMRRGRTSLFSYMSSANYEEMAETPIKHSFSRYRAIWWGVLATYILIIGFIIYIVIHGHPQNSKTTQSTPTTITHQNKQHG